jgi:hypothetical protein
MSNKFNLAKLLLKMGLVSFIIAIVFSGCVQPTPPPQWSKITNEKEAEYNQYLKEGTGTIEGQAFLTQQGGGVVKGAGRTVTLNPSTSVGNEWWGKAGKVWIHRSLTPSSPNFHKARKTTIADADGKFKFKNLPKGKYFISTEITWNVAYHGIQGGLLTKQIEIKDNKTTEVILNEL